MRERQGLKKGVEWENGKWGGEGVVVAIIKVKPNNCLLH